MTTRFVPILAVAVVAACSRSSSSSTGPGPTGALDVTITAPAGVTAKVHVITPDDSVITINASQTLNGLAPGNYLVRASSGTTADPIVGTGYTGAVTGSPATVAGGQTASATVTYGAPRANVGVLWVANEAGNTISGFSSANLSASGAPAPGIVLGDGSGTSSVKTPMGVAVDSSGGVWWVSGTNTISYYTASQVAASTNAAPARKITSASLSDAISLAFDPSGDLWVADRIHSSLNEFTPAQLQSGGSQPASVIIGRVLGSLQRPWPMAFDAKGDLWVSNFDDSSVVGYAPAQLQASGYPVPYAAISLSPGLSNPMGIAFDPQGNLWVGNLKDSLSKFTPDQLTSVGRPTPAIAITFSSVTTPDALAFDNSGSLWVLGFVSNKLLKFTANQLTSSGAPAPAVLITTNAGSLTIPGGMVFSPSAGNVPVP